MYKEFRPHPLLTAYVDAYWIGGGLHFMQQRILPDTCADIIFNISEDIIAADETLKIMPGNAFVVGTMTTFHDTILHANTYLLGVRFKPGGLNSFTGLPLQLITDDHVPLRDIASGWHVALEPLLMKAQGIAAKLACLEKFLLQRLPAGNIISGKMQHSIAQIRQSKGVIAVNVLAAQVYMSPRNFERHFLQTAGVSPKTFARIVRFLSLKQQLKSLSNPHLLSLALDHGFYDHAHLTREFRSFAGESPTSYMQR
ncbi:AraC-like DNA-binding protein [Chitinophaga sp. W3I9]|uniref:AraC family transcriptional regulator n=1 Tax=unclassified Chitinophaga TaxID=2619133 RepID=UPI003D1ABFAA